MIRDTVEDPSWSIRARVNPPLYNLMPALSSYAKRVRHGKQVVISIAFVRNLRTFSHI